MAGRFEPLKSPAPQPFPAAHLGQAAVRSTATVAVPGPIETIFPTGESMQALSYEIQVAHTAYLAST
jgi:hypothetical protein